MSEPEGFLTRWSRRKRAPADADAPAETPAQAPDASADDTVAARSGPVDEPEATKEKEEPAFDLSTLPSIESITAETDIRAFLAPGVPPALTQAALRRAWVVDPKIRDFIEIAENQWDFTVTGGAPGFDLSAPTGDIARMLKDVLPRASENESPPERTAETAAADRERSAEPVSHRIVSATPLAASAEGSNAAGDSSPDGASSPREIADVRAEDIATQNNDASQNESQRLLRRSHGGAMPR